MEIDLRLLAPRIVYDKITDLDTYEIPIIVVEIDEIPKEEYIYLQGDTTKCRDLTFEMLNENGVRIKRKGLIWENSYKKIVDQPFTPFATFGKFIFTVDGYRVVVYNKRWLALVAQFEKTQHKTEIEIRMNFWKNYQPFFDWAHGKNLSF